MYKKDPIIILGPGRSGTSVIAGMLHYLGVYLGDQFIPADINNPTGHFEDVEFTELNRQREAQIITKEDWKERTLKLVETRRAVAEKKNVPWGWKIPMSTNFVEDYKEMFDDPVWVYCYRPKEDVIKSCINAYRGMTLEEITAMVEPRYTRWEKHKDALPGKVIELDFNHEIKALKVDEIVKKFFKGIKELEKNKDNEKLAKSILNDVEKDAYVMISVPCENSIHPLLVNRLLDWVIRYDKVGIYVKPYIRPVDRARNGLVKDFLETKATHLMMVDSDTVPPLHAVMSLLKSDKDIVSGFTPGIQYQQNGEGWFFDYTVFKDSPLDKDGYELKEAIVPRENGLVKVRRVGGACLMIKRHVLEGMEAPWFKNIYEPNGENLLSEDYYFCEEAIKKGFEVWANGDVKCKHFKLIDLN